MVDLPNQRRVAVFTGSRAEYGLLRHLVGGIAADPDLSLQLIVSGSHLSACQGGTLTEIEADGHKAAALVPLSLDQEPPRSMALLSAEALEGVAQALEKLQTDLLILLGDRYETFAAAAAAHLIGVKVVHLHGGETTKGAVDDRLRHAISQLSTWHFTAAEPYRQRVISMGHPPTQVFNVGPMVLDGLIAEPNADRRVFEQSTGFRFGACNLLITYHPETMRADNGLPGFQALLEALRLHPCHVLFTYPNADAGSDQLLEKLQNYVQQHPETNWAVPSLGQKRYLAALQLFEAMAGNSSSGIIEAPLLGMPVLNIGDRQAGRLRTNFIIDANGDVKSISEGIKQVLNAGKREKWPRPKPQNASAPSAKIISKLKKILAN